MDPDVIVSKDNDGWTGRPCPRCKGCGLQHDDEREWACGACGGTGAEYRAELDLRTYT